MVQAYQEGKFLAEPEMRGKPRPNPMSDPAAMEGMMGMMKGQMTMMIPQTLIMGWINAFFSGFVISKFILRATQRLLQVHLEDKKVARDRIYLKPLQPRESCGVYYTLSKLCC